MTRTPWLQTTGGIVAVLLLTQFCTGVLLAFYYVPSVDHAYTTVSYIEKVVSSGSWLRAVHHYGSQWLAVFSFLHVIQLFATRAYESHRVQWIASILLLGLIMAAAGTGYSLPWDARAFFSTRVAEGLVGGLPLAGGMARLWLLAGNEISTLTLSRFFALHVLVVAGLIIAVVVWRMYRGGVFTYHHAIAGGVVFVALALWCLKYPAPLGPSVATMMEKYLPRPGAQFLWLYESLKYLPGGLGSIAGVVLPGIVLLLLIFLPWLRNQTVIGTAILGAGAALVLIMTTVSYVGDHRDPQTAKQFALQAAQEETARREPFKATPLQVMTTSSAAEGGAPVMYMKFCVNCHGPHGEGARQGTLNFPPLLDVATKPRRNVDDIVGLLKDPTAYGLQPPMRSFSDKLTEPQMRDCGVDCEVEEVTAILVAPCKNNSTRRDCQMKLISLALACVAIALFAAGCTETATPTNTSSSRPAGSPAAPAATASVDEFATARANYKKNCEACHGPDATGGPVKVDNKQIKVPSVKSDHAIKHPDDKLTKMITNGEEEMPAFKDKMSAQEIAEMVRFIRKEFQGK